MRVIGIALMCAAGMVSFARPPSRLDHGAGTMGVHGTRRCALAGADRVRPAKALGWIDVSEKRFDSDGRQPTSGIVCRRAGGVWARTCSKARRGNAIRNGIRWVMRLARCV